MAINETEAAFIAQVTGDSDMWPDHEKHVYHINLARRDASEYLFNDDGNPRINDHCGLIEFEGKHADNVAKRVYVFVATDEGATPTINDPDNIIVSGLGD